MPVVAKSNRRVAELIPNWPAAGRMLRGPGRNAMNSPGAGVAGTLLAALKGVRLH